MNTKSRVSSLDLQADLEVEVQEVHLRRRRFWERKTGMVRLSVEGKPSVWLAPGDVLTITHRITEAN